MALNDVAPDNQCIQRLSGTVLDSGAGSPARMFRKLKSIAGEAWSVRWSLLTAAEIQTLRAVFDTAGPAGPVSWTPPGEGSARVFRVAKFSETASSAVNFQAELELHYLPGVTI
jgi:hypothetical protein